MNIQDQIIALLSALGPFLVSLAVYLYNLLISKLPANQRPIITEVAQMAVNAAEQLGNGASGTSKKVFATGFLESSLKAHGIIINDEYISALIESAVHQANSLKAPVNPPVNQTNLNEGSTNG